jgi:hypothetical protein
MKSKLILTALILLCNNPSFATQVNCDVYYPKDAVVLNGTYVYNSGGFDFYQVFATSSSGYKTYMTEIRGFQFDVFNNSVKTYNFNLIKSSNVHDKIKLKCTVGE